MVTEHDRRFANGGEYEVVALRQGVIAGIGSYVNG
jgi:hypothetical protein